MNRYPPTHRYSPAHRRALTAVCILATALGPAACAADEKPAATASAGVAPSPTAGSPGFFGGTDLAWVEITIAMDEELLPLLTLVPANGSDPALKALSAEVTGVHERELTALRGLHDQADLPAENPHKGMPMPGMVTPEQVTAAAATRGKAFDDLVRGHLEAHLRQGLRLAESERKSGIEPQTRALADDVLRTRRTYLNRLGKAS
ncbi:DUF305 domain-containing protein [Couchioplanes caeruleus]|uniref:DUF305 domain-containing protein n=1 Tax=Couchioplanes caeruleus TaxID=56438 RepID=UPI0020C167CA|nr:DUF305 domain-containing protein [Couchioplanes caeruleus]UQU66968.1 DUF305 domain-containing protein [Couchioplanes caeruleus]